MKRIPLLLSGFPATEAVFRGRVVYRIGGAIRSSVDFQLSDLETPQGILALSHNVMVYDKGCFTWLSLCDPLHNSRILRAPLTSDYDRSLG